RLGQPIPRRGRDRLQLLGKFFRKKKVFGARGRNSYPLPWPSQLRAKTLTLRSSAKARDGTERGTLRQWGYWYYAIPFLSRDRIQYSRTVSAHSCTAL